MARIAYADPEDLTKERRPLLDTLSDIDNGDAADTAEDETVDHRLTGGTLNVYRTMGRHVPLLAAFREYGGAVWHESGLTPHERETVILSTAVSTEDTYEWQQHVRVALDEGMDTDEIVAISAGELDRLAPERAALVDYVDAFVDGTVDDDTHATLARHYDDETILGIGMLTGCYLGLARLLQALDVDLESPFVGWDLADL